MLHQNGSFRRLLEAPLSTLPIRAAVEGVYPDVMCRQLERVSNAHDVLKAASGRYIAAAYNKRLSTAEHAACLRAADVVAGYAAFAQLTEEDLRAQ